MSQKWMKVWQLRTQYYALEGMIMSMTGVVTYPSMVRACNMEHAVAVQSTFVA